MELVDLTPAALARARAGPLEQDVLARDPEVRGARLDVRRHIGRAHRDHADVLEQQLAVVATQLGRVEPELAEQVHGPVEQRAAGHRDRQAVKRACAHRASAPVPRSSPASAMCRRSTSSAKPTAGRDAPKVPSSAS